jgi:hemolysin activation/secretion protein
LKIVEEIGVIPTNFLRRPGFGSTGVRVLLSFCLTVAVAASTEIPAETADQPGMEQRERPGRERPDLPAFIEEAPPEVTPLHPVPETPRKSPGSSAGPRVLVTGIRWVGNTVFSDEELSGVAGDYLNREITFEELQELRLRVTRHYIDGGYINSGAVIPDQEIVSGEILINIVEGRLAGIDVSGNDRLRTPYIKSRLMTAAGPPLNINDLQEQVQILHQNPLIDGVNAELSPGLRLGEAILAAEVAEASLYVLGFGRPCLLQHPGHPPRHLPENPV